MKGTCHLPETFYVHPWFAREELKHGCTNFFSYLFLSPFQPEITLEHRLTWGQKTYPIMGQLWGSLERYGIRGSNTVAVTLLQQHYCRGPVERMRAYYLSTSCLLSSSCPPSPWPEFAVISPHLQFLISSWALDQYQFHLSKELFFFHQKFSVASFCLRSDIEIPVSVQVPARSIPMPPSWQSLLFIGPAPWTLTHKIFLPC